MSGYSSVEEWVEDLRKMVKNKNSVLAKRIEKKLLSTDKDIRQNINKEAENVALEINPLAIIPKIMEANPNHVLIVNNDEGGFWFYV